MLSENYAGTMVEIIERAVREICGVVTSAEPLAETETQPYAVITAPRRYPVKAKNGIAGYTTMFEISIFGSRLDAEMLKHRVIKTVGSAELGDDHHCYLNSVTPVESNSLAGFTLSFDLM